MAVIDHRYTVVKIFVFDSMKLPTLAINQDLEIAELTTIMSKTFLWNYLMLFQKVSYVVIDMERLENAFSNCDRADCGSFPKWNAWQNHACAAAFASH